MKTKKQLVFIILLKNGEGGKGNKDYLQFNGILVISDSFFFKFSYKNMQDLFTIKIKFKNDIELDYDDPFQNFFFKIDHFYK